MEDKIYRIGNAIIIAGGVIVRQLKDPNEGRYYRVEIPDQQVPINVSSLEEIIKYNQLFDKSPLLIDLLLEAVE